MENPNRENFLAELTKPWNSSKYDLLILDRICDRTDKISTNLLKQKTRQEVLENIDKLDLKKTEYIIKSLINYMIKHEVSPFSIKFISNSLWILNNISPSYNGYPIIKNPG